MSLRKFTTQALMSVVLLWSGQAAAESTFEELSGKFMMDLPEGYQLLPQKFPTLYQFDGGGGRIIVVHDDTARNLDVSYRSALENLDGVVANPEPIGKVVTQTMNGNPAKWGVYRGEVESDGATVALYASVGSTVLKSGSLFFMSFQGEQKYSAWGERISGAFRSIRDVGEPVLGVKDIKKIDR